MSDEIALVKHSHYLVIIIAVFLSLVQDAEQLQS